jgi:hypothetical protein
VVRFSSLHAFLSTKRPYLAHVKRVARGWHHLGYLADWMEVTTAPPKWKHVPRDNRALRAARTRVAIVDFPTDPSGKPTRTNVDSIQALQDVFNDPSYNHAPEHMRLFVLEDLSRDMIEEFGSRYDVDPAFWRGHISDYLWYNTRDPWVELDDLPHIKRERSFYNFHYMHPRYFNDEASYNRATLEAGRMNVLRRLDNDQTRVILLDTKEARICMVRSKASLWVQPSVPGGKRPTVGASVSFVCGCSDS